MMNASPVSLPLDAHTDGKTTSDVPVPPTIADGLTTAGLEQQERTAADPALRAAWEKLIQYDRAALRQKQAYVRLRAVILLVGFFSTVAAVALSANDAFSHLLLRFILAFLPLLVAYAILSQRKQQQLGLRLLIGAIGLIIGIFVFSLSADEKSFGLQQFLQLILFLFPLLASGLLAYASQFIPSQLWAKFRFSAEMIRREIFLYRLQAGEYFDKPKAEQQKLLLNKVDEADQYCERPVHIFEPPIPEAEEAKFQGAIQAVAGGSGFQEMRVDDYITKRLSSQYAWYVEKSFYEYRQMRRWQIVSLVIGSAGSLLAYQGYAPWVAVTTSAAVTVNMLASLTMYGRTYSIYLATADKLHRLYLDWNIESPDQRDDKKYIADYINNIESAFKEEIEQWMQQVEKSAEEIEKELAQHLPRKLTDAKPATKE